ncbi:putative phage baseplate assembly protein [Pseudomonas phage OBP]|uniref:Phage baseplate assembly protein n=1 Tax=Pseudomonas phage OBP TaxID=1124849 RepID=A0ACD6B8L5_9CAUD|nr:baseplate assembly protein [Pseudomonas phage OBP]AEV89583.1 putative phage baseplate assembly protein [Pseudomonas phage OBP]
MNVLECYGVGVVAMDKDVDTDEVQIHIKGLFPESDGEVTTTVETKNTSTLTPTGDTQSSSSLQSNTVPAKWMALNTNRVTAPDVRKGSKVVVYKFQGTSKYLWTYFGMDGTLRLETIIWAFSASPNVDENTPVTPENYYMLLLSTHQKKIQLLTGQGNGEPTSYAFELNTGEGKFSIVDGENNILSLNSMAHALSFINDEKSFINIEKKDITLSCEKNMLLKGKDKIDIQCTDLSLKADKSISMETQKTSLVSPEIYMKGNVTHEGNYNQLGNYTVQGNVGIQGAFSQFGGAGSVEGGWTIDNIRYLGHRHGGVQSGGSKTDTPSA